MLETMKKGIFTLLAVLLIGAVTACFQSCKAWRTITTTASYTISNDSTKTATSIATKTVEEYQGVRKR